MSMYVCLFSSCNDGHNLIIPMDLLTTMPQEAKKLTKGGITTLWTSIFFFKGKKVQNLIYSI